MVAFCEEESQIMAPRNHSLGAWLPPAPTGDSHPQSLLENMCGWCEVGMPHVEKGPAGVGSSAASILLEKKSQNNVKSILTFYK